MLQVFNYNESKVTFRTEDGVVYVNATEMAKSFAKKPIDFLRQKNTQEYILELESEVSRTHFASKGGNTNEVEQGTWMHELLALEFAGWLSARFRIWCNQRIKELLLTGKTELKPQTEEEQILAGYKLLLTKVEQIQEQNKLLTQTVTAQAPKVQYHDEVLQSNSLINTSIIAKELGMSANALNKLLHEKRIIYTSGGTWLPYAAYQGKGYMKQKTFTYNDSLNRPQTKIQSYWTEAGRLFVHQLVNSALKKTG